MKGLSKDKEVAAALQLANESIVVDDAMLDEAIQMNSLLEDKAKYKAFFDKALKKFGVDSPADLKGDKKKEFFDWVDANYEAENEED
jgi:Arc/MetJ family transcription regulator